MSKPLLSPAGVVRLTAGQAESALRQLVAELDEAKVLHRRAIALLSAVAASEPHLATFDYELLVEGTVGAGEVDAFASSGETSTTPPKNKAYRCRSKRTPTARAVLRADSVGSKVHR